MTNPISLSVAPATRVIGSWYGDLRGTVELVARLARAAVVDGVEFQYLAEWDRAHPPRDEAEKRLAGWQKAPKYTLEELAQVLQAATLPVLSVHANRDVGVCLCMGQAQDVARGRQLAHEALRLAETLGAPVCVFHLWDTWKGDFDPGFLQDVFCEVAAQYPGVKAAVENVPTHLAGATPFELVRDFEWITLDLQWAALYDELDRFEALKERIANVHLRGHLDGNRWALDGASFGFYEALDVVRNRWGYAGPLTMEPNRLRAGDWERLLAALSSLREGDAAL